MKTIKQTKTFEVGQIAYCNGGCTMQLPTFYKVVKRTDKTVWLQEIANQLIEHDGYGQRGRKIPVDIPTGAVFNKRVKNWKDPKYEWWQRSRICLHKILGHSRALGWNCKIL